MVFAGKKLNRIAPGVATIRVTFELLFVPTVFYLEKIRSIICPRKKDCLKTMSARACLFDLASPKLRKAQ